MPRSFSEIQKRVKQGDAVVLTSQEVCELVASADASRLMEVDVVTTATRAVMSGTYAVFSFRVAEPGTFLKAERVWINGVAAQVGPCPNENLGVVDLIVFGTARSSDRLNWGGGHLFRELVERKPVLVEVETNDEKIFQAEVGLDEMPFARLNGSRHAFMNYSAFINPGEKPLSTIFHARPFEPHCLGATFSGCGQINPIKNDPLLETIGVGTRILLNGAEGFVLGTGTRSSPQKPNLSGFADMHHMKPEYMGGFATSAGPECICSWAVPIPVTSKTILQEIARLDRDIALPVMDVNTREAVGQASYADVWQGVDLDVEFDSDKCRGCASCQAQISCPTRAIHFDGQAAKRDETMCFHCGLCAVDCPYGAFQCNLGSIRLKTVEGTTIAIPVVLRQSDKLRALMLAEDLKNRILDGSFMISRPVERIS